MAGTRISNRHRSDWRENLVMWGAGIGSFLLGFPLALYVHEHAPGWELVGVFATLALAGAFGLLAWRVPRARLATGGAAFFFLLVSMCFAIVHGWMVEVEAIAGMATLVFMVLFVVYVTRLARAQARLTRALLETDQPEPAPGAWPSEAALLADADAPIVLCPRRGKVALYLAGQLVLTLLVAGLFIGSLAFWLNGRGVAVVVGILGTVLFGLGLVLMGGVLLPIIIYRLVVRRPVVILTQRGLIDHASAIATGVGSVPWEEVAGSLIYATPRRLGLPPYRYLILIPAHPRALLARQSFLKRRLLALTGSQVLSAGLPEPLATIHIPAWLLPVSLEELREQISRRVPPEPDETANETSGEHSDPSGTGVQQ